jgi:uncharacterized protein YcaQ
VNTFSRTEARKIILKAQGLHKTGPFGAGPESVIKAVEHLGYVQLDTISVIERAHHHVLWSRIPSYKPQWLDDAQLKTRRVFEYWSHAAAYLPMKDYRFSLPVMNTFKDNKDSWPKSSKADMKRVLERIHSDGPVMSRDFESNHKGGTWWDWKPPKWALQRLFLEGHIMVSHRKGFQRVYDLPERIIPTGILTDTPSTKEYYTYLIVKTLEAQGLAARNELMHLRHIPPKDFDLLLNELTEAGNIEVMLLEGSKLYFTLPSYADKKIKLIDRITLLSPFDNAIIWRNRLKDIFGFEYTLECYLPAHKRTYGYFCLPILYKDQFAGRIDMKVERTNRLLKIHNIFWDEGFEALEHHHLFEEALNDFALFNQCDTMVFNG